MKRMVKDYWVHIPPTLAEVLADIGHVSEDSDFDEIVNSAYQSFFSFYTPVKITASVAVDLEKFVLNYFIMRRVGSGNIRKWRQMFRNKWMSIIPYYERLLDTQEKESDYFKNPIANVDIVKHNDWEGTLDQQEDSTRNTDTDFNTQRNTEYDGRDSKSHQGSWSESGNSTEINRYLDTPQGVADRVWETDGQGHLKLSDYYLPDIRGITDDYQKSGSDQYTESGTDSHEEEVTGQDTTDVDETGQKIIDQDTTHHQEQDSFGYEGVSPSDLMLKYRETFMRIYEDIVKELEEVFYGLVEVDDLIDFV